MAKKKKTKEDEPPVVEGFVSRNQDAPEAAATPNRITLYLNEEGAVDWDKTKGEAADQLIDTITKDPDLLEKVASCPDFQDSADDIGWSPQDAGVVLDVLAKVESLVCSKIPAKIMGMKVAPENFWAAFTVTEEEHARQDPLAAKVMDQFLVIPEAWKPVVLLATAHSASVIRSFKDAIKLQMVADGRMPARANGHAQPQTVEGQVAEEEKVG